MKNSGAADNFTNLFGPEVVFIFRIKYVLEKYQELL